MISIHQLSGIREALFDMRREKSVFFLYQDLGKYLYFLIQAEKPRELTQAVPEESQSKIRTKTRRPVYILSVLWCLTVSFMAHREIYPKFSMKERI